MFSGPENEPYVNIPGFIRSRNRVELEGQCVVNILAGKEYAESAKWKDRTSGNPEVIGPPPGAELLLQAARSSLRNAQEMTAGFSEFIRKSI